MQLLKDLFFFIGATLGILAFVKPLLESSLNKNREKWKKIQNIVSDIDFDNVRGGVLGYRIPGENHEKVRTLVYDFRGLREHTVFNSLLRKLYREYFESLDAAYSEFRELVQVDEWEPNERNDWVFNKEAKSFADENGIPSGYRDHIFQVEEAAEKLYIAFKRLQILSDIEIWQVPFAKRYVERVLSPNKSSKKNASETGAPS